ncbi:hypothetical protein [Ideonella sp.]|uniref:hypothetical protein n=1 Tax=Ideonella sp. TaxID=1929293 RepID=UPI002B4A65E9|nr:hypothetical protein [Ideonella sp.]HJV70905.1 hypothetical protein [Ideonella sp.]
MSDEDKAVRLKTLAREIRDDLGEHNVLDALARELAAERLALADLLQDMAALKRELDAIKLVQKSRDILLPQARTQYAGRRKAVVEAGMPMPAEHGFYALERDGVGNPFRWTGPSTEFHFNLHLDRSVPLRFVLQMPLWGAEHAGGLRATCDEMTLPLLRRPGNRVLDFEGMLLPRESLGVTRLTFIANQVRTVPAESDEGAPRQLGVPFLRLTIGEASEAEFAEWLKAVEPDATKAPVPNKPRPAAAAPASNPADGAT